MNPKMLRAQEKEMQIQMQIQISISECKFLLAAD